MSKTVSLKLPLTEADVRGLSLGDMVILDGEIVINAGIPGHRRILDHLRSGEPLPIDLTGAAFFHLASYNEIDGDAFRVLYVNPTTSTRFNGMMPEIIRGCGLRATGGKGGLDAECAKAMAEVGCVYLAFLGGGAPIHSEKIKNVVHVAWNDMTSHYRLVKLEVERLGPLTVAIDAHGNSLYDNIKSSVFDRRDAILAQLKADRDAATSPR